MPALVAGIHLLHAGRTKTWMAGTSPAMTTVRFQTHHPLSMRGERVQDAARIVEKETHHGAEQNQKKHQPEQDRQRQPDAAMTRWCMSVAKSSVIPSRV